MSEQFPALRALTEIFHYHIHVYYDETSRARAVKLHALIGERFAVQLGRFFDQPVGPHTMAQYEIGFFADQFAQLVPWLMLNHFDLPILLHPNTDQEREDHRGSSFWLGQPVPLLLERLDVSLIAAGHAEPRAVTINSTPTVQA
ncbi:MAG: DOPA 4,5-dioxygenase family protein [Burkholderiales bacterium]|nr:DOPA 4,5-dioxygenase family protein [Burkholderiales bacterium]